MSDTPEEAERELRKYSAQMQELIELPVWRTFVSIIESQIATREHIILNNPAGAASDGITPLDRLLQIEQIKGARLGLKLALSTPQDIIDSAKALNPSNEDEE